MKASCVILQGFIHSDPPPHLAQSSSVENGDLDAPLPSINLSNLVLSQKEVAHAFHLPLSDVRSATRLHEYLFRGGVPYFAIDVSDIINRHVEGEVVSSNGPVAWASDPEQRDEIGGGREGRLEVWGLTGWYLNVFLKTLGLYE